VNDLPAFDDYNMAGRTYRFFNGTPLYPFGFGLSYTTFVYKNLRTNAESIAKDGSVTVSVDVTNTGSRAGDEVVQLYVRHEGSAVERPKQDLRGYSRVELLAGETKTVTMKVDAKSLAYWNAQRYAWVVEAEPIRLRIGASSADIRLEKTIKID
jgi:beta-glucosidase